jgi:hypothetical protein
VRKTDVIVLDGESVVVFAPISPAARRSTSRRSRSLLKDLRRFRSSPTRCSPSCRHGIRSPSDRR